MDKTNIEDIYPLSDIQKGMIYYSLRDSNEKIYHNQNIYNIDDIEFNENCFHKAIELAAGKHQILRTGVNFYEYKEPIQIVFKNIIPDIKILNIADKTNELQNGIITKCLEDDIQIPFDFKKAGLLWRIKVFITHEKIILAWICHHSILDGWSSASLITELSIIYSKLKKGIDFYPSRLKSSYKDFIVEQLVEKENKEIRLFWKNELAEFQRFTFPQNGNGNKNKIKVYSQKLDPNFENDLRKKILEINVPGSTIFLGAYMYMLNMLSYNNDILIGYVTHNRPVCEDGDKILGCFLNTVPFRVKIQPGITWKKYIETIDDKKNNIAKYGRISLFEILRVLDYKGKNQNPLFDTHFNYMDFHVYDNLSEELKPNKPNNKSLNIKGFERSNALVSFAINNTKNGTFFGFSYNELLFNDEFAEKLGRFYKKILEQIIYYFENNIEKQNILKDHWGNNSFKDFGLTTANLFPNNLKRTLHIFSKYYDKIAIKSKNVNITFSELARQSKKIAKYLTESGIKENTVVAIKVNNQIDELICIYANILIGSVYVTLDYQYTPSQIDYILKDCCPRIILTNTEINGKDKIFIDIAVNIKNILENNKLDIQEIFNQQNCNYYSIRYSFNSKKIKKNLISISYLLNYINWFSEYTNLSETDHILFHSTVNINYQIDTIFAIIYNGGTVNFIPEKHSFSQKDYLAYLSKNCISILFSKTYFLNNIIDVKSISLSIKTIRLIILDTKGFSIVFNDKLSQIFRRSKVLFLIGYSDLNICYLGQFIHSRRDVVGKEIIIDKNGFNNQLVVMDSNNELQPEGIKGELCIVMPKSLLWYLNEVDINNEQVFYSQYLDEFLYKTGRYAHCSDTNKLVIYGNIKNQEKNGEYYLDIEDIENTLAMNLSVKSAVVNIYKSVDRSDIAIYYTSDVKFQKKALVGTLRNYLLNHLPEYMLPSHFIQIDNYELNLSGEVDKLALPEIDFIHNQEFSNPANEVEKELIKIWSNILGLSSDEIGRSSNFFELGGHSINAIKLISTVQRELKCKIEISELFRSPTVESIAKVIVKSRNNEVSGIIPCEKRDYYPLSFAQNRFMYLQKLYKSNTAYNINSFYEIDGRLDIEKLKSSFKVLIQRHEPFRTSFHFIDGKSVQRIHDHLDFDIKIYSPTSNQVNDLNNYIKEKINDFIHPYDLASPPMFRVGVIAVGDSKWILMYDFNHIIADGTTHRILIDEFLNIYNGYGLKKLNVQYKDYTIWQNKLFNSNEFKKKEEFWKDLYSDNLQDVNLPTDYNRPDIMNFEGNSYTYIIPTELTKEIKKLANDYDVTVFIILLTCVKILVHKITGKTDIRIGVPYAQRNQDELETMIGNLLNTLVIRSFPKPEKRFGELLKEVKDVSLKAFDNHEYPFEMLLNKIEYNRSSNRNPLFDIVFNSQNLNELGEETISLRNRAGLNFKPFRTGINVATFELGFYPSVRNDRINLDIHFKTSLFSESTIKYYIKEYVSLISQICNDPNMQIKEYLIFQKRKDKTGKNRIKIKNKIKT